MHWIGNADSYICPVCRTEVYNPAYHGYRCPICGFMDEKDCEKMKDSEKVARPDYEAECNRLTEENAYLKMKLSDAEAMCSDLKEDCAKFRAQLDIVYLIFGKR